MLNTVKVPKKFERIFEKAESYVSAYFGNQSREFIPGKITISGERYILVRAASLSVDFFSTVKALFGGSLEEEAKSMAKSLLYDIAHSVGKEDARKFHIKNNLTDPLEKLSVGPVHFSYTGWASVDISPQSNVSLDENFLLIYDHLYSFESDAWLVKGEKSDSCVCVMNAGYSSGWCEESFGQPLIASEILCKARGDKACRFIMAPPLKIKGHIEHLFEDETGDICKQRKIEIPVSWQGKSQSEALKEQLLINKTITDNAASCLFMIDKQGHATFMNPAAEAVTGYTLEEIKDMPLHDAVHYKYPDGSPYPMSECPIDNAQAELKKMVDYEDTFVRKDGSLFPVICYIEPLARDGEVLGSVLEFQDTTERKHAEEKIKKLSLAVEQSSASIIITSPDGTIEYVNKWFEKTTGYSYEEVIGQNPRILKSGETSKEEYQKLWETILSGEVWRGEFRNRNKEGGLLWETGFISPIKDKEGRITHFLAVKEDITRAKQMEEELNLSREMMIRSERLASIGVLAAGVAHEVLNPLNIISLISQTELKKDLPPELREQFKKIKIQVDRAAKITTALKEFSGQRENQIAEVNVHRLFDETATLVEYEMSLENITIERDFDEKLQEILADKDKLAQVFLNLLSNARDAMQGGKNNRITIKTKTLKDKIEIQFSDTGPGIPKENIDKIFDPFFTTKEVGKGTGLGLSIMHTIVEDVGGTLSVESEEGQGATFIIPFPLRKP